MSHKQVKLFLVIPRRRIEGVEAELYRFLNSAVEKGEWSNSQPGHFMRGNKTRYTLKRMLDGFQRLSGYFEEKSLLPAVTVLYCTVLYLLSYPGSHLCHIMVS